MPHVDVLVTEMRNTRHRQPAWYRYVAGMAGEKPAVVVENPYGGIVPELVDELAAAAGTIACGCRCTRARRWA